MRRALPFALIAASAAWVYACSSDPDPADPPAPGGDSGTTQGDTGTKPQEDSGTKPTDDGGGDGGTTQTGNPIDGVAAAKLITDAQNFQGFADGPQWKDGALYFSDYFATPGVIWKYTPPNTFTQHRTLTAPYKGLGTTVDERDGGLVTAEVDPNGVANSQLVRWTGDAGTPLALSFDGGAWDSPNDLVVRKSDGTMYVTDPSYQKGSLTNRVFRVTPAGAVVEVDKVTNGEHPNGIALSADAKTLYVSFTNNVGGPPFIRKYAVNPDGTLGAGTKFADVPPNDSAPDGLGIDEAGNVYAAVKDGVEVFKADGSGKWGKIPIPKPATGVAFGGADRKTLYVTANGGVYEVTGLKVAGVAQ